MSDWKSMFDTQKRVFEGLQAGSPEEADGIKKAVRLNRQGLEFAEQGRMLEAQVQFKFLDSVADAIRNGQYKNFMSIVDFFSRAE